MVAGALHRERAGRLGVLVGALVLGLIDLDRGQILQAVVDQRGQVVHTLTGRRGDGQEGQTLGLDVLLELLDLLGACNVALVAQHDLRTVRQLGTEPGQLVVDLLKVRLGVAALAAGDVNDVQQQAAALNMAQEVVAEADALRSTLDQTGDVGADKALLRADADDAQHGGQRREVVVGDLGTRGRNNADERRFADVREADQAHVRNDLQLELEVHILAGQTGLGKLGDLAGRGRKMAVAPAAASALGHDNRLTARQIGHDEVGLGLLQHGAAGHADDQVVTVCAAHPLGAAILAVGRGVLALVAEVHQGGQVVVGHKDDVAAAPAVTAVGAARRHEFFAVERHRTVAALAGVQPDRGGINKITGCHVVPHLQKITKNERAAKARPYRFFYCLTVQRLRSRPMRSK